MSRTNQILLLLVAALAAFIVFVERRSESTARRAEQARHAFVFQADRIRLLAVENDGVRTECVRDGDRWNIVRPVKAPADAAAVQRILFGLEQMPHAEVIAAADRRHRGATLADFGLDRPRARVSLTGEGVALSFEVGQPGALGRVYLREEGREEILATGTNVLALLPASPAALRDHTLLAGDASDVRRLQIRRSDGFLEVVRQDNGEWRLRQPVVARADREAVVSLVNDLLAFRIADFVQDGVTDASPWGFDEASVEVTLDFTREDLPSETLLLGRPDERQADRVYARLKHANAIYTVPVAMRARLLTPVSRLRDRRLVPFLADEIAAFSMRCGERELSLAKRDGRWQIAVPVAAPADEAQVEDFLREWTGTRVEQFPGFAGPSNAVPPGFEPPSCRLALLRSPPADTSTNVPPAPAPAGGEDRTALILWIGGLPEALPAVRVASADGEAFVRIAAKPPRYTTADPLLFRDREVLRIRPDDVYSIARIADGTTQRVERADTGAFSASASGVTADAIAIARQLAALSGLRAQSLVNGAATNPAEYGLQAPAVSVTLGLRGEAGLAKTLLFGRATPEGVFGLVRGQDLVFLLDPRLAEALQAPLWKKAAAPPVRPPAAPPAPAP